MVVGATVVSIFMTRIQYGDLCLCCININDRNTV